MATIEAIEADIHDSRATLKNIEEEKGIYELDLESPLPFRELTNELKYPYTVVAEQKTADDVHLRLRLLDQ